MPGKVKLVGEAADLANMLLCTVTSILERHGVHYALTSGTLLGIVRENRLLPWDTDMDLMVSGEDQDALSAAIPAMRAAGLKVITRRMKVDLPPLKPNDYRIIKVYAGAIVIDLIAKYSDTWHYYWCVGKSKVLKRVEARFYDELTKIAFNGNMFWAPQDLEAYLTARYGEWRTPVKDYNYKKDDMSIIRPGT